MIRGNVEIRIREATRIDEARALLRHVLAAAVRKFDNEKIANSERRSWARIIISSIQAYGDLLESSQLDDLESRLEMLEDKELEKRGLFQEQEREVKIYG